jgi:asparagine synthase (glutamine-hydrolysing)
MDSSTLVALAAQLNPGNITTYTVRFADKESNEEPYARSVANKYHTEYRVLESPTENFWPQILAYTYLEEEPYHSPNEQTHQVMWIQMRSIGTKVSLVGAGGDENFGGYGHYFRLFQIENLLERRFLTYLRNGLRYSAGRTHMRSLALPFLTLTREAAKRILATSPQDGNPPNYYKGKWSPQPSFAPLTFSEALYADMTNTLMPYWLRAGDRNHMGVPIELRCPFLDYRVVEFAFRLPVTYLINEGWQKWILRKAVEDLLPQDVLWRRQKLGFPFPYPRFYRENYEIIELLLRASENPYIDLAKFNFSQAETSPHKWKVLSFLLWYELFFNENVLLFKKIEARARQKFPIENYGYAPSFLSTPSWGV